MVLLSCWQASSTFISSFTDVLIYFTPFIPAHFSTSSSCNACGKSHLLPTSNVSASGHLARDKGNHLFAADSKEARLERSKTSMTPWQPWKQLATMERYFSWPAVSQMQSLMGWPPIFTSLILKSMMVTDYGFFSKNSPYKYFQKSVVLPTPLSPTMIILNRGQLPFAKYRSSSIDIIQMLDHTPLYPYIAPSSPVINTQLIDPITHPYSLPIQEPPSIGKGSPRPQAEGRSISPTARRGMARKETRSSPRRKD